MSKDKYGHLAYLKGICGNKIETSTEFFVPINDSWVSWVSLQIPTDFVKKEKIKVIIVDRNEDRTHTAVMLPDNTIIVVRDEMIQMRWIATLFNTLAGKKIKRNELE